MGHGMRGHLLARIGSFLVPLVLLTGSASAAPAPVPAAEMTMAAAPEPATLPPSSGGVAIGGGAAATRDETVTLALPPPADGRSTLRISNDGGSSGAELPWTTSLAWSLIDASTGGEDVDGVKTVTVEAGTGDGAWSPVGAASILLDRTGPVVRWSSATVSTGPHGDYQVDAIDAGVGVGRTEISLDGVHWRTVSPTPWDFWYDGAFDLREGLIGGSYGTGQRLVHGRIFDRLGNMTVIDDFTVTMTTDRTPDDPKMTFLTTPLAVTGRPFTIEPVNDDGYRIPSGRLCRWRLIWGSERVRLMAQYDATYGEIQTTVAPVGGACEPWTFTLPYTSALEYSWTFAVVEPDGSVSSWTEPFVGAFRATRESSYRGILESNLPLYTMVPDRDYVGIDGRVTYRLYARGGAPERRGQWDCHPADGYPISAGTSQLGGSSFSCPVTTAEPWVARWAAITSEERWRFYAGYDPIGDRSLPVVRSLRATVLPESSAGTSVRLRLTWRGTDTGTGIRSYAAQVSTNGGGWMSVPLGGSLATSIVRGALVGSSYRFRVRAVDRAGNIGAWVYTPPIRPARIDDRSSALTWSSGWSVGGGLHVTDATARTVTAGFSGQAVGILAPRGPGMGWAQIYLDGVLAGTIDLSAAAPQTPRIVWQRAFGVVGTHTIRIRTLGTSGRPRIALDGLVILR